MSRHRRGRRWLTLALVGSGVWGCDHGAAPALPATLSVSPTAALLDSVGSTVQFAAEVRDASGARLETTRLAWRSSDPAVAWIDANTGLAAAAGAGTVIVTGSSGTVSGAATLEVYLDPNPSSYAAGETYFGRRQYIEYQADDLPLVLAAPHGGADEPGEIPARTFGITTQDRNTQDLVRALTASIRERSGRLPHVVICRLHRRALDANRDVEEAAQGSPFGERAWEEYHSYIDAAKATVTAAYGRGLFIDLHGHGHEIQRLELGYLLRSADLQLPDAQLDQPALVERSSIRVLADGSNEPFSGLVRGETSLGTLLELRGFPAVPSSSQPDPGNEPYFTGGYSTARVA